MGAGELRPGLLRLLPDAQLSAQVRLCALAMRTRMYSSAEAASVQMHREIS